MENRLIRLRLSDFTSKVKYNPRTAEANKAVQDAERAKRLLEQSNALAINQGTQYASSIFPSTKGGAQARGNLMNQTDTSLVDEFGHATQAGILNQAQSIGDGAISYDTRTGVVTKQKQREDEISNIPRTIKVVAGTNRNGQPIYRNIPDPNYAANVAAVKDRHAQEDATEAQRQATEQTGLAGRNAASGMDQTATQFGQPLVQDPQSPVKQGESVIDRQTFIQQKRDEGLSDAEIRNLIETLPPEQTGGITKSSVPQHTNGSIPTDSANTPSASGTDDKGDVPTKDESKTSGQQPDKSSNPNVSLLRGIAETVEDPIMRAILNAEADMAELQDRGEPMTPDDFLADSGNLTKPFDAIDEILTRARETADKTFEAQKDFLKTQYDRQDKLLSDREENKLNKLRFSEDKAKRDQRELNKKILDQNTIMLALGGGFGSDDGNRELLEATRKGEQALIDMSKEFGFKRTDVSLAYTEMYNQAFDKYSMDWQTAMDNFETRVSNIDIQGISNQQAKSNALKSAYKDYVSEIKEGRKEAAKTVNDALKFVHDTMSNERDAKKKDLMSAKDKLGFVSSLRTGINQNKIITLAKDVDGFYGAFNAGYNEYKSLLEAIERGDIKEGEISLNPSQSGAIGSLARMFDPGSVVRNEEYERQVLGQSAPAIISGWWQKLKAGGTGLTPADLDAMKRVADGLHDAWEEKLSNEMQPFILDIQDWNANYPEAPIDYSQVIPVDRVYLPSDTMNNWSDAANDSSIPTQSSHGLNGESTLFDFFSVYAPSSDNNSPSSYASAVARDLGVSPNTSIGSLSNRIDEFASAIAKHEGFTSGASRLAVVNNNPGNLKYIGQNGATMGEKGFAKFKTVEDGYAALRNDIRAKIGVGKEIAKEEKVETYSLVPTAEAAEPENEIYIYPESNPIQTGSLREVASLDPDEGYIPIPEKRYRNIETGSIVKVKPGKDDPYKDMPYLFTLIE